MLITFYLIKFKNISFILLLLKCIKQFNFQQNKMQIIKLIERKDIFFVNILSSIIIQ